MADLRNQRPHDTYQFIVTTDRTNLYDGSGSLLTNLNITNITSSQVTESIILTNQATASTVLIGVASASIIFSTNISSSTITASSISAITTFSGVTGSLFGTSSQAVSSSFTNNFVRELTTGSSYPITSSFSITSSYITAATSSTPAASTASALAWLSVTVSGSVYKIPLYQ